jgi:ATP-dependent DNA ligase
MAPPSCARAFTIDGEAVVCVPDGVAVFDALHGERRLREDFLYAFDLLEVDGRRTCGYTPSMSARGGWQSS